MHTIFLLKKNIRTNIIKIILGYPPIVVSESLKEQKVVIISVRQGYKSIKGKQDYRMKLGIIYEERDILMDIAKAKDNYNKDRKPKYFNYNIYKHMVKYCKKPKKEKETKKYYKYNKVEYIAKTIGLNRR